VKENWPVPRLEEGGIRAISMVVSVLITLGRYAQQTTFAKPPMSIALYPALIRRSNDIPINKLLTSVYFRAILIRENRFPAAPGISPHKPPCSPW